MGALLTLWQFLPATSFFVLLIVTAAGRLRPVCPRAQIPVLRTTPRIYEFGLELVEQGKSKAFRFDELDCMSAEFEDHQFKHQYIGTQAKIEFLVDGRYTPYTCECEYRHNCAARSGCCWHWACAARRFKAACSPSWNARDRSAGETTPA